MTTIRVPRPLKLMKIVVPVSREDIEDFYGPLIVGEIRKDYEAGCPAWLVEETAFTRRILGPAFGWKRGSEQTS